MKTSERRKGLQWWGRSRLAQTHMRWAKEELREGNRQKALWNVEMALSLAPRMAEAVQLKEQLTETAYWADEYRETNVRFIIERMIMQELALPFPQIVPPEKPRLPDQINPRVRRAMGIGPLYEEPLPEFQPPEKIEDLRQVKPREGPDGSTPAGQATAPQESKG